MVDFEICLVEGGGARENHMSNHTIVWSKNALAWSYERLSWPALRGEHAGGLGFFDGGPQAGKNLKDEDAPKAHKCGLSIDREH